MSEPNVTEEIAGLSAKLPDGMDDSIYRRLADYMGKPLVIHFAKIEKRDDGDRAVFVVSERGSKEQFYLTTRAGQPMRIAQWGNEANPWPLVGMFMPQGKKTILVDPAKMLMTK